MTTQLTTTPEQLDAQVCDMMDQGTLLGSIWGYGAGENPTSSAPVLMSPTEYGLDSGWRTLKMAEWAIAGTSPAKRAEGSGELDSHKEIRLAIFRTMAREGLVKLIAVQAEAE